jgi:hypothetical protein
MGLTDKLDLEILGHVYIEGCELTQLQVLCIFNIKERGKRLLAINHRLCMSIQFILSESPSKATSFRIQAVKHTSESQTQMQMQLNISPISLNSQSFFPFPTMQFFNPNPDAISLISAQPTVPTTFSYVLSNLSSL